MINSRIATFAFVPLLLISAASAQADERRCTFQSRYTCNPSGCAPANDLPPVFIMLQMDKGQYGRCDIKSCDWLPMTVQRSGKYLNLNFSTGIQGAKISQDGTLFIETISMMDVMIVSYGQCQRAL